MGGVTTRQRVVRERGRPMVRGGRGAEWLKGGRAEWQEGGGGLRKGPDFIIGVASFYRVTRPT